MALRHPPQQVTDLIVQHIGSGFLAHPSPIAAGGGGGKRFAIKTLAIKIVDSGRQIAAGCLHTNNLHAVPAPTRNPRGRL
ncbi:hypothetical protein GCM10007291_20670 [Gemmobacter nanjingensis]|uniref:Uncharacterized protein n=1 Tax=Gemmobacter nanjingensis TaxID=488454 RepID=A0ABQ3FF81_9RHOB|nr:hypothetical protein GCM10007291_20670 [Gemmobacter nanjingensis]